MRKGDKNVVFFKSGFSRRGLIFNEFYLILYYWFSGVEKITLIPDGQLFSSLFWEIENGKMLLNELFR
jgi:hypothetical protein